MEGVFLQISILFCIVFIFSFLMRLLKQPPILGYIFSGIAIGPFFLNLISDNEVIQTFSEFGIAFLLFIVGLYLSPKVVKEVGKVSFLVGFGQITLTAIVSYFIGLLVGFSSKTSIYLAIALTLSSTIIIMKILSDKGALDRLYSKISIGILLVQDIVAIIVLIVVSSLSTEMNATDLIVRTILKGVLLLGALFPVGYFLLPKLSSFFAKSQEFLFVFAISWGLGLSALFLYAGFSLEIGALIAGVLLSMSPYSNEISSKLKPLRDFFVICFFIYLGTQMVFKNLNQFLIPIIVFSLFILIGKPLIVMILMRFFGYSKSTGFMSGLTMSQISEFSLILVALGVKLGQLDNEILSFVAIVGLITIAGSTYMIMYSDKIYSYLSRYLSFFEPRRAKDELETISDYEYYLFGENRVGFSIMKYFINSNKNYLVIDFNPVRIKDLLKKGVSCMYGDLSDIEFIDNLKLNKAKMVVSTVPDFASNLLLLEKVREKNKEAIIIVTSRQISDTIELYKAGADYVILPHFSGGEHVAEIIEKLKENKKEYVQERERQLIGLQERLTGKLDSKNKNSK